eukprot:g18566.t1
MVKNRISGADQGSAMEKLRANVRRWRLSLYDLSPSGARLSRSPGARRPAVSGRQVGVPFIGFAGLPGGRRYTVIGPVTIITRRSSSEMGAGQGGLLARAVLDTRTAVCDREGDLFTTFGYAAHSCRGNKQICVVGLFPHRSRLCFFSIPSSQQALNFKPDRQGQGALRPMVDTVRAACCPTAR